MSNTHLKIRAIRLKLGLSKSEVAEKIGMSIEKYSAMENTPITDDADIINLIMKLEDVFKMRAWQIQNYFPEDYLPQPSPVEFERIVMQMRASQIDYFKTRSKSSMIKAKELEKKVDEYLSNLKQ